MKKFKTILAVAAIAAFLFGCRKEDCDNHKTSHVYTLSNQANGNSVILFERNTNGSLEFSDSFPTGGKGTGAGLGSQGALTLSHDHDWLFAVNAGSNEISVLRIKGNTLELVSKVPSGGNMPVSITSYQNWVYVLNAGDNGSIAGFYLTPSGSLTPIPNSVQQLSGKATGPAQISFTEDGANLVITEKAANKIVSYNVTATGTPGEYHELSSASPTPFGFAVGNDGYIFVSEAMQSALSVYRIAADSIRLVDGPVLNNQNAACWVVLTKDGKYAYTANAASNSISGYRVSSPNEIELLNENGVTAVTGSSPIDEALSSNSKYLYVLNSSSHSIRAFSINTDGSLQFIDDVDGLPIGAAGLTAN